MKISSVSTAANNLFNKKTNFKKNQTKNSTITSFKALYAEDSIDCKNSSNDKYDRVFDEKTAQLLTEISYQYPYQDCFIRANGSNLPYLGYRERPNDVDEYNNDFFFNSTNKINMRLPQKDRNYPIESLILYENSPLCNFIGLPSSISFNPSLPYTVKAGYELHKKLLEKKFLIEDAVANASQVYIDSRTLVNMAHSEIEDVEVAVTRHLMESAYAALSDKKTAKKIYNENYSDLNKKFEAKRRKDLTTSVAKRYQSVLDDMEDSKIDICEYATKKYPNTVENYERIKQLSREMTDKGMCLS